MFLISVTSSTILVEPNCEATVTDTGSVLIKVKIRVSVDICPEQIDRRENTVERAWPIPCCV